MLSRPVILSIAGYDPSSGAGVTADVKTAAAMDCFAVTCPTALTVQTTQGVFGLEPVRPEVVRETLRRLAEDVEITAVRIGMLGSGQVAEIVAELLEQRRTPNVVLDPVIRSSSGMQLTDSDGVGVIRHKLLPLVAVATPNFAEAAVLAHSFGSLDHWKAPSARLLKALAARLHEMGCPAVVITGGDQQLPNDYLSIRRDGQDEEQILSGSRIESQATHGTGCAFATALACALAHGRQLPEAVRDAKEYVRRAIAASYPVGKGTGPVNHLFGLHATEP